MVYIISSTTPWPAAKEKSINLLYEFKNDSFSNIFFGGYGIIDSTVIFKEQERVIFDEDLEKLQNPLKIGQSIKGPLFSSFIISNNADSNRYMDYTKRALNFYELFEGTNKDNIWLNLEKLIHLALTQKKMDIDVFFIRLSFFPEFLLKNSGVFFQNLYCVFEKFPTETFVIILDPQFLYLYNYICKFAGMPKTIAKFIDFRNTEKPDSNCNYNTDFVFRLYRFYDNKNDSSALHCISYYTVEESEIFDKNFDIFISHLVHKKEILIQQFEAFNPKPGNKGKHLSTYKTRLKTKLIESFSPENRGSCYVSQDSLISFLNKYFDDIDDKKKRKLFSYFQRLPIKNSHEAFNKQLLDNRNKKYSRAELNRKLAYIFDNDNTWDRIKYHCGKQKLQTLKQKGETYFFIPPNNADLKEFIFQAGICTNCSIKKIKDILQKYGFIIVNYSLKDYMYQYLLNYVSGKHIDLEDERDDLFQKVYTKLSEIINLKVKKYL